MLTALKVVGLIGLGTIAIAYIIIEIAYRMNKEDEPEPPKRYRY